VNKVYVAEGHKASSSPNRFTYLPRFVLNDSQASIQYFDTMDCTEAGHQIGDSIQDLCDITDTPFFNRMSSSYGAAVSDGFRS